MGSAGSAVFLKPMLRHPEDNVRGDVVSVVSASFGYYGQQMFGCGCCRTRTFCLKETFIKLVQ